MAKKLCIYAIKDVTANEYNTPFIQPSDVHALRVFKTEINRAGADNLLYLYPEEYELHYLGSFDTENASIVPENKLLSPGVAVKTKD